MPINERFKANAAAATGALLDITWTANEPTAANTQTIADGTVPTVAELGQFAANMTAIVNALIIDIASIRTQFND